VDKSLLITKSMDIAWDIVRTELASRPPNEGLRYLTPEDIATSFHDVFMMVVGTAANGVYELELRFGNDEVR
jgi:hypothetical protein